MIKERAYDPTDKAQVLRALRREIRTARLKVTLDEKLGRETSPVVLHLARMSLPQNIQRSYRLRASKTDAAGPAASGEAQ